MNNPCGPVPLLFITGFLGSGKTTLLNRILDEAAAQGKKIGVIINEWGRVNIDSSLIRAKDIEIEELNDGQVFCSCLSGNFLEALVLLAKRSLDVVIVETSGMANPFPLRNILCDLKRLTGGHYVYQGMIALIDPESFLDLVEDINAVEEQVIASQRIIINKIELADGETLAQSLQRKPGRCSGRSRAGGLSGAHEGGGNLESGQRRVFHMAHVPTENSFCGSIFYAYRARPERPAQ